MDIGSFISPDDVFIQLKANSKKQVLEEMVRLASTRAQGIDPRTALDLLAERERLGCTGIGKGIAIPHTRCRPPSSLSRLAAVLAVLDQPVDFDAGDGVPVDIVFMLLAPQDSGGEHLAVLALASRLLSSDETAEALRRAASKEEAWSILSGAGGTSMTAA